MVLRKGGAAAKAADKANRPSYDKVEFFKIEEDDGKLVIRFFDDGDEWPFSDMHSYVPTRGPAEDWDDEKSAKYPSRNGAVCRKDEAFVDEETGKSRFDDCYICDKMTKENGKPYRPQIRMWARAIVRIPIVGTQKMADAERITQRQVGKVVGHRDEIVEVDETGLDGKPTGKKFKKPRIVVVNMGMKNFFNAMQGYYQSLDGTVRDRDFLITREGLKTDTNYIVTMLERTPDHDLNDPETRAVYEPHLPDLERLIEDRASDDYYAYFFDKRVPHPERKGATDDSDDGDDQPKASKKGSAKAAPPAKDTAVNADRLRQMSAEVRGRYGKGTKAESEESAAPAVDDPDDELVGAGVSYSGSEED